MESHVNARVDVLLLGEAIHEEKLAHLDREAIRREGEEEDATDLAVRLVAQAQASFDAGEDAWSASRLQREVHYALAAQGLRCGETQHSAPHQPGRQHVTPPRALPSHLARTPSTVSKRSRILNGCSPLRDTVVTHS